MVVDWGVICTRILGTWPLVQKIKQFKCMNLLPSHIKEWVSVHLILRHRPTHKLICPCPVCEGVWGTLYILTPALDGREWSASRPYLFYIQ
jgi:hypothetical protein